jgi:YHS domain-containing protein
MEKQMRFFNTVMLAVGFFVGGVCLASAREATRTIAMDGYCPVTVVDNERWAPGDSAVSATHRGQTFFFHADEQREAFLSSPDKYAPVLEGQDLVAVAEGTSGELRGSRSFGLKHHGRVFLFHNRQNRDKFSHSPAIYEQHLRRLEQMSNGDSPQVRPDNAQ